MVLILSLTLVLTPPALAAESNYEDNFTPSEALYDPEIQSMTDSSSVLNESDIIYMVLTDRFYDGDSSNNGTLGVEYRPGELKYTQGGDWKGLQQKLDYIKNLGMTAIWIPPPSENELLSRDGSESGYHGYFTHDYNSADPHFGTKQDLVDLVNAAHEGAKRSYLMLCRTILLTILPAPVPHTVQMTTSLLRHSTILTGIIIMVI